MEYIDNTTGIRNQNDILQHNSVLTTLNVYGEDTSLYAANLLDNVTDKDLYVLTKDGRIAKGTVKCSKTKQKDDLAKCKFAINMVKLSDGNEAFQILLGFPDGTWIDSRGHYARTHLRIVRRGK